MKRKNMITAVAAMVMAAAMSMTAFAAGWQQNTNGWWWQNDDGTWPVNTWQWIDGNHDGVFERYHFGADGYMLTSTTTTDGYAVNGDGAWIIDGFIQTKKQDVPANTSVDVDTNTPTGYNSNGISNVVLDMLDNTRAENTVKYGETEVLKMGNGVLVYYANGFRINYLSENDNAITYDVMAGLNADCSTVFKDAISGSVSNADTAAQRLENKGYHAVSDGVVCVITFDNKYQIQWYGFSGTNKIKTYKQDAYRLETMGAYY